MWSHNEFTSNINLYLFTTYMPVQNGRHFADGISFDVFPSMEIFEFHKKFIAKDMTETKSVLVDKTFWQQAGDILASVHDDPVSLRDHSIYS